MMRHMLTESSHSQSVLNRRSFLAGLSACASTLAGCGTVSSNSTPTPPPAPTLRILSYNIHHGEGTDGKVNLARIAQVIMTSGADLVALQEVDRKTTRTGRVDQATELGILTRMHVRFGAAMAFQGGDYGQAILSRWPILMLRTHFLPNPAQRESRIAVSAVIQTGSGHVVRFVSAHLDANTEDDNRWLQAIRLQETFGMDDSLPVILAGDLNDVTESRSLNRLTQHWTDASAGNPIPTVPSGTPQSRIDYVLLRPKNWEVRGSTVLDEAVASDHRPLLVTLALPPAK